jgi:hypothetical protein
MQRNVLYEVPSIEEWLYYSMKKKGKRTRSLKYEVVIFNE